ncbi:Uncharacterised protein [[Clostridium] sordellii]|nr:Uncharacterised protein [[Clostridium] sordellii] [Paeniclostridium sordellii]
MKFEEKNIYIIIKNRYILRLRGLNKNVLNKTLLSIR